MSFHPYLNFGGNCGEAFTRYKEIFGGELVLLPMSEVPAEDAGDFPGDVIAHAALMLEGGDLLMGSDDPTTDSFGPVQGMHVNYTTPDMAEADRVYEALADGGKVIMPIGQTFWSPKFGMCVDRFGVPWMVNYADPDQQPPS